MPFNFSSNSISKSLKPRKSPVVSPSLNPKSPFTSEKSKRMYISESKPSDVLIKSIELNEISGAMSVEAPSSVHDANPTITKRIKMVFLPSMSVPFSYKDVFEVKEQQFNDLVLEIFRWQAEHIVIYKRFLEALSIAPESIQQYSDIPFLPIEAFKTHEIIAPGVSPRAYFESSSTTGLNTSKHYYDDINWYHKAVIHGFEQRYGKVRDYCFLALLPGYLERENASLISMVKLLMDKSQYSSSGFYLHEHEDLKKQLKHNAKEKIPTVLFGVTFALLDFAGQHSVDFNDLIILETGGMKGRGKEITRADLHETLSRSFIGAKIQSEYGMTELFSQAYMNEDGLFECPPWMRISLSSTDDPFARVPQGKTGLINVIDLANIESCCFIATSDLGRMHEGDRFEVLGRFDHSEQRGCNLMVV